MTPPQRRTTGQSTEPSGNEQQPLHVTVRTVYAIECAYCGKVGESRDPHLAFERMREHVATHVEPDLPGLPQPCCDSCNQFVSETREVGVSGAFLCIDCINRSLATLAGDSA